MADATDTMGNMMSAFHQLHQLELTLILPLTNPGLSLTHRARTKTAQVIDQVLTNEPAYFATAPADSRLQHMTLNACADGPLWAACLPHNFLTFLRCFTALTTITLGSTMKEVDVSMLATYCTDFHIKLALPLSGADE